MVKKISSINKQQYQQSRNNNRILQIGMGIAAVLMIVVFVVMNSGGGSSVQSLVGPAPSGKNCPENVAYLQSGVDKYKELVGAVPTDLKQLIEVKDGNGPFVEKLVECPSGNLYVIDKGIVKEVPRK